MAKKLMCNLSVSIRFGETLKDRYAMSCFDVKKNLFFIS
jgi:hypothetical protein